MAISLQEPRVYFGTVATDAIGGPKVKGRRMAQYFTNHTDDYELIYSIFGHVPMAHIVDALARGIPVVYHLNSFWHRAYAADWREQNRDIEFTYHNAAGIVYGSEYVKQAAARFMGERQVPHRIIYNAVDTELFTPPASRPRERFNILCMGNHTIRHRVEPLLRAMPLIIERIPGARLIVAGNLVVGMGDFDCGRTGFAQ